LRCKSKAVRSAVAAGRWKNPASELAPERKVAPGQTELGEEIVHRDAGFARSARRFSITARNRILQSSASGVPALLEFRRRYAAGGRAEIR
jgi:hypothetical protein